jgi:hypothetical protein
MIDFRKVLRMVVDVFDEASKLDFAKDIINVVTRVE